MISTTALPTTALKLALYIHNNVFNKMHENPKKHS